MNSDDKNCLLFANETFDYHLSFLEMRLTHVEYKVKTQSQQFFHEKSLFYYSNDAQKVI